MKIQDGTHFSPQLGGSDYLYVTSKHIEFGRLDVSQAERISTVEHMKIYGRCDVKKGDLLLTKDGANTGNAAINDIDEEISLLSSVAFLRFDPSRHDSRFFLQYILSNEGQRRLHELMAGNAITRLTLAKIRYFAMPVPLLDEQRAIADVLSDVDGLIGALEELIGKKHAIKQAAMQELLTGKTRLPGFAGKWDERELGEVADIVMGQSPPGDTYNNSGAGVPLINGPTEFTDTHPVGIQWTTAPTRMCRRGDLLICVRGSSTGRTNVADNEYCIGRGVAAIRGKPGVETDFVSLQVVAAVQRILAMATGSTFPSVDRKTFCRIVVHLPGQAEQAAIAAVLSDMGAEIEALERRREKARQIKQGMMQQLLTGRVRLVKPQPVAETSAKGSKAHSSAFNEAVIIATLAKHFGSEQYPLGRLRYTKLSYLLHRHTDGQVEGYLKKAAGPYNPKTRYGGSERIAVDNGYVREQKSGAYNGFVAADKVTQAEGYFEKWYGPHAIGWLEQFRFKKNDELELLATVDMAAEELRLTGKAVDVGAVKAIIAGHPEWQAKLGRDVFSDANIAKAIETCRRLFDAPREG